MSGELNVVIATDCGSTTTKAILIEKGEDGYRQTFRGEAPTTVEAPIEDVTRGVLNAIEEVEELSGRKILEGDRFISPATPDHGVDLYISTSSAGGGLQMMVAGVVDTMTGESAQRAALGAGAIVMDVLASNDGRQPHEKIERIRHLRPDMILLSGGTDGGTVSHVVELAEFIAAADPRPRFGSEFRLPVIFAGNRDATPEIDATLGEKTALTPTENIRPVLEQENLGPARHVIHDLFLEHVMAQAPGYSTLMDWAGAPIVPTPGAVGLMMQSVARQQAIDIVGVDIGGATTDVFSVFDQTFNRSVSANLGMSYSVSNVLAEAGLENVLRWIPFDIDESDLKDRIKNKMIRPTTVPQTLEELQIEQAIAREALRLAFDQHRALAVGLKGVQSERGLSDVFEQPATGESLIQMMGLDLLIASGGVLSHAPRRHQTAAMLIDAFQPEGVTRLAVDSIFMMPHLGLLSTIDEQAAADVFDRDCLVDLGTCVAPVGRGSIGTPCLSYELTLEGETTSGVLETGSLHLIPCEQSATLSVTPEKGWDVGADPGQALETVIPGGKVGLILDGRGRPIEFTADEIRHQTVSDWAEALSLYP
ncbi:MAG: methylaspartate mutase [Gemmatimonadetes bacterium]|nr:methylaspartate mutase [Gemmatimonadota bacterium]|tara:strand:+ start:1887 stop:3665 length:1779 start_codon:yes stop_codon:yes gene_type:complete